MNGWIDHVVSTGISQVMITSHRGLQILNPSRVELRFYRDAAKEKRLFKIPQGFFELTFANLDMSGKLWVKASDSATITINIL